MAEADVVSNVIPNQAPLGGSAGPQVSTLQILVVDDNILNLRIVQAMISRFGHRVDTVVNGEQAIEAVRKTAYDVVLMDVRMPEMDGPEATRRIRGLRQRQPRIIALTASSSRQDRLACQTVGMDGYLVKPLRAAALTQLLNTEQRIAAGHP